MSESVQLNTRHSTPPPPRVTTLTTRPPEGLKWLLCLYSEGLYSNPDHLKDETFILRPSSSRSVNGKLQYYSEAKDTRTHLWADCEYWHLQLRQTSWTEGRPGCLLPCSSAGPLWSGQSSPGWGTSSSHTGTSLPGLTYSPQTHPWGCFSEGWKEKNTKLPQKKVPGSSLRSVLPHRICWMNFSMFCAWVSLLHLPFSHSPKRSSSGDDRLWPLTSDLWPNPTGAQKLKTRPDLVSYQWMMTRFTSLGVTGMQMYFKTFR